MCYIFGGQGGDDHLFNDLYSLSFDIDEGEKKFIASWEKEDVRGKRPSPRTSHSCTAYRGEFLILIGGEGLNEGMYKKLNLVFEKVPLNDVWIYTLIMKSWSELKLNNPNIFEGRFCHSASLSGDKIFIYGGMKNAEETLDNLSVLCLNGKIEELEECNKYNNLIF